MGHLPNISGQLTVNAFGQAAGQPIGQVGNHLVMVKAAVRALLALPQHRELSVGTLRKPIRNSGLTVAEFRTSP